MRRSANAVTLLGNVGAEPEYHQTEQGTPVAHIRLATHRGPAGDGESTEWHRLTLWNRLATWARQNVRVGDQLYVEGRIEYGPSRSADIVVSQAVLGERAR